MSNMKDRALELMEKAEAEATCAQEPAIVIRPAITRAEDLPALPPEVVEGIIRRGGKLLITGASKAGKSYLLIELAAAVAVGGRWVGFNCAPGRVLYLNLEIQEPQFLHRVQKVCERKGYEPDVVAQNLDIANLRGQFHDIEDLVDALLGTVSPGTYDLVIVDPAYKVQAGRENDADAITAFCAGLDRLAEDLGCTIAYTHHHSKGAQGGKNAEDRGSGSGVFARDADALVDMVELQWDEALQEAREALGWYEARPFRLEFVLRDFKQPDPVNIWFNYPIHEKDPSGALEGSTAKRPGGSGGWHQEQGEKSLREIERALDVIMGDSDSVPRSEVCAYLGKDPRTVGKYVGMSKLFALESTSNTATIRRAEA